MGIKTVVSVVAKTLGNPKKAIVLAPETVNKIELGVIRGIARGVKEQEDPKTQRTYYGLMGFFKAESNDPEIGDFQSGKAFLADGLMEAMVPRFLEAQEDGEVLEMAFVYRVGIMRATNAAGYSWYWEQEGEITMDDPLASLPNPNRAPGAAPALTAPSGDQAGEVSQNDATGEPEAVAKGKKAK